MLGLVLYSGCKIYMFGDKYVLDLSVEDNLKKDSIIFMALFSIAMMIITQISRYFEVKNNWQRLRCRPEVMPFAWLYGKDTASNMEYCLENAGLQVKQSNIVAPTVKKIDSGINKLSKKIQTANNDLANLKKLIGNEDLKANNRSKNIAVGIQENILALKEGMQKVIAGLVIQNQMSNGILKTTSGTKKLTDSLNKSLNKSM